MTSGPITSWEIDGEIVSDFIVLDSKITADGDCSHEIKKHLLVGRKAMTNLDSIVKSRDTTLPTKVKFSSVTQPCSTLRPLEPHHVRPPCPSPTPRVHLNPLPLSW